MKQKAMNVITGGLGFIGNELVRQLKAAGEQVAIIDNENRIAPYLDDLSDVPRYKVDITDAQSLHDTMALLKPACVFHLAAIHYIPECNAQPERTLRINVEGTLAVLNAAKANGCKHVVFASTGAVYHDAQEPLTEESAIAPVDIYGWSKWFAEELCRSQHGAMGVTICRLFNNIGWRETNPHIVPEIISQLRNGNRVLQLGNIKPIRDYISTRDTASALIQLGQHSQVGCDVFNVATGHGASVEELIACLSSILGEKIQVETDPNRFRQADKQVQLADISKLKKRLQWEPQYSMSEVLEELLRLEKLLPNKE